MWARILPIVCCVLVLGCSSGLQTETGTTISPNDLLEGASIGGAREAQELVDNEDVLALTPEMRAFLGDNIHMKAFPGVRLQELIDAIINEGTFGLEFDGETRTASETFELRKGNCLSFSNMFIAMARHIGLSASYQEVNIPPDWTFQDDVFLLNRHVNVYLDMGPLDDHVVDFNIDDFKSSYSSHTISDARARAHYFNNMGVDHMQAGDTATALAYYRRAIAENDRRFSPAWSNLGTLYLRNGQPEYAEAAYLHALHVDSGDLVAMSNLARFYERQGNEELAAVYHKKVRDHRKENPYYRYQRARDAFAVGDYRTAIGHLKYAIRKKGNEDQFYHLLGMSYLQLGNRRAAERSMAKAKQVAATAELKRRYSSKLDALQTAKD